jgi:FtsP/CotA-like multicopper oxidase with cupredoxin domain
MRSLRISLLILSANAAVMGHALETATVVLNDNQHAAGVLREGVLTLNLRAGAGLWNPEGPAGRTLRIEAFGEEGGSLSVPAPLVRVPEGAEIRVRVRNTLDTALKVGGLCERGGSACPALDVPPHEAVETRFKSGPPGTYHYWASSSGMPFGFRAVEDAQLSGAFIVDPLDAPPSDDRVLVITEWTSITREQLTQLLSEADPGVAFLKLKPSILTTMNGRAWPFTERLIYDVGQTVRWRIVNLSTQVHPMHLHGFYFEVDAVGDGARETRYAPGQSPRAVTQVLQPGGTMQMRWVPERAGNWLFHCHVMLHVSPVLEVDGSPKAGVGEHAHHGAAAGMTGLVTGITVRDPRHVPSALEPSAVPARRLTLTLKEDPKRFGEEPALGFVLADAAGSSSHVPVPGPTLVLERDKPVEITLANQLAEDTAVHWHGMELESYYDGVHGWGRTGEQVTPVIAPGEKFVVRFTPPRAGTFMYHTHFHDNRQLTSGLYGAMIVVDPREPLDHRLDHVIVIGRGGPQLDAPVVLNGQNRPQLTWAAGTRHRVRLINITPNDVLVVSLQSNKGAVTWRPLTKDGAPVPADRDQPIPASQLIAVGETYDFAVETSPGRQHLWLEVRTPAGRWEAQGHVIVK